MYLKKVVIHTPLRRKSLATLIPEWPNFNPTLRKKNVDPIKNSQLKLSSRETGQQQVHSVEENIETQEKKTE